MPYSLSSWTLGLYLLFGVGPYQFLASPPWHGSCGIVTCLLGEILAGILTAVSDSDRSAGEFVWQLFFARL